MIEVRVGELAEADADAFVRPVSTDFSPVTPAMRRFEEAAGSEVAAQCRALGDVPIGSAVITAAGALPGDLIIHVAVRSATENPTRSVVRRGFLNALRRAGEWGASRLAVAPLGTGAGNLDAETAADIMLDVLGDFRRTVGGADHVVVMAEDAYQESAFLGAVSRHTADGAGTRT